MPALVALCLCLAALLAGCDGNDAGARRAGPSPSPRGDAVPACFDTSDATEGDVRLHGDVDGRGGEETVSLLLDRDAETGCRALLLVSGERDYAATVEVLDESVFRLGLPAPRTLVELDGTPGLEVVVTLHSGASTEFAALYNVHDGRLTRMTIEDAPQDLIGLGGSVAHLEGADCSGADELVVVTAIRHGRRYVVTQKLYRVGETSLELRRSERMRMSRDALESVPALRGPPFLACG